MGFQVVALDTEEFTELYGVSDDALASHGVERHRVQQKPGYLCRVSLVDFEPRRCQALGDTVETLLR